MRSLVVVEEFPWPVRSGLSTRISMIVQALATTGPVDLFAFRQHRREEPCVLPDDVPVERLMTWRLPPPDYSLRRRLTWLGTRGLPLELIGRRPPAAERTALREAFDSWRQDRYDVAWFDRVAAYDLLGGPSCGPTVVDLDDLQDLKLRLRIAALRRNPPTGGTVARARLVASMALTAIDARKWAAYQRMISRRVDRVVLCSESEITASGFPNAAFCPNGYPAPNPDPDGRRPGDRPVGDPPRILFQGQLDYLPNVEAAQILVNQIGPLVRRHFPSLEIRLAGHAGVQVQRLHAPPGVTVLGRVESMTDELVKADVVVVPLQWGGGTRLKIIEALAHRVPVVATTIGAEGLGLAPGSDLLIADDIEDLARACVRLLSEPDLRSGLVEHGYATFLAHHERSVTQERVRDAAHLG